MSEPLDSILSGGGEAVSGPIDTAPPAVHGDSPSPAFSDPSTGATDPAAAMQATPAPQAEAPQAVSPEIERIHQALHAIARETAFHRFSEAKVNAAEHAFIGALQAGQLEPADYRRVVGSPNRYAEAVRWHQRQIVQAEIGDDPVAFKARLEAELREKIMSEMAGEAGGGSASQRLAPLMPSNLAGARNAGARGGPAWAGPASLADIFDRRKPG